MAKKNPLLIAPPYLVEQTLKRLGANLRTARLRRNLTINDIAAKIGAGRRAVTEAEKGNPSTGIAIYVALLWAMDMLSQLDEVTDPTQDEEGQRLALSREPSRAKHSIKEDENDF